MYEYLYEYLHEIINWIVNTVSTLGYPGVFILMLLESSFIPFPSEVIMVPAGYLAFKGQMNIVIVILCGLFGSLVGALINYYLAKSLGRRFLLRYGSYVMFKEETLLKMEDFFSRHGHISTFTGRLIPMVRQYISIPAGLARMNIAVFSFYTSLGAGIWVIILTLLGYYIGENELLIKAYLRDIIIALLILCAIGVFIYWYRLRKTKN